MNLLHDVAYEYQNRRHLQWRKEHLEKGGFYSIASENRIYYKDVVDVLFEVCMHRDDVVKKIVVKNKHNNVFLSKNHKELYVIEGELFNNADQHLWVFINDEEIPFALIETQEEAMEMNKENDIKFMQ